MRLKFFLSLSLATSALAVGNFINWSGGDGAKSFHPKQVVNLEWTGTADYSTLSLGYFSQHNTTVTWLISNSPNYPTRYSWVVTPGRDGFNFEEDDQFHLWIVNGTDFESPFYTPMFYIRRKNDTTSSEPTSAQTPTPSSNAPSGTVTAGESGDGETSDDSGSELSTGAKAGIGVGAAVGGLLVIGASIFFILHRRKAKKPAIYPSQASYSENKKDQYDIASEVPAYSYMEPVEAPTNDIYGRRQELGGGVGGVRAELE